MLKLKNSLRLSSKPITVLAAFLFSAGCLGHPVHDIEAQINRHLEEYNPHIQFKHDNELIQYAKKCHTKKYKLEVKPFRYRLSKYRVYLDCPNQDRISAVTELNGTIDAYISKTAIERKTPIHKDLVSKKPTNIESIRGIITTNIPDLYYSAKGNIKASSVIYKKNLTVRPTIKRGDAVTITASFNGISMNAKGVALEDGMFDQKIEVENTSSKKVLMAVVIDDKTVRVN